MTLPVRDRFIEALETRLYEKYETFASNPLLLTVMLIMFDDYGDDIPEKLHLFYEEAFLSMYMKHDATKGGYRRERTSGVRDYDDFRMIFACFCFISYANGETEFSWDRLAEIFQQVQDMAFCKSEFSIEAYVNDLMEGLCVLYQDGTRYLFTHRSFQEYFTAVFLTRQSDENMTDLSLQLIENDVKRAIRDQVFHLIKGMDEDKYWNNVILPILRDFEREISEKTLTDEEKFAYYFGHLFRAVYLRRWFEGNYYSDVFSLQFIKVISPIMILPVYLLPDEMEFNQTEPELIFLFEYLQRQTRYKIMGNKYRRLSTQELANDSEAMRLIMKTQIGQRIIYLMNLRKNIEAQKKKRSVNLSSLMKKRE